MCEPKISIVTITFNSGKTLEETILSVISQNYSNLEYLIIDGGSTDETLNIIEKYKNEIAFTISEPDRGIGDAFNKGIKYATGDIIGILNSDDVMLPGTLFSIASNYQEGIDVYTENVLLWNDKSDIVYKERIVPEIEYDGPYKKYVVAHPGRFISRDAYVKFGVYDIRFRYCMDLDLLMRFFENGAAFKRINYDAVKFRCGGTTNDSISKKKSDYKLLSEKHGGNVFSFSVFWAYLRIRDCLKQLMIKLFGFDRVQAIIRRKE